MRGKLPRGPRKCMETSTSGHSVVFSNGQNKNCSEKNHHPTFAAGVAPMLARACVKASPCVLPSTKYYALLVCYRRTAWVEGRASTSPDPKGARCSSRLLSAEHFVHLRAEHTHHLIYMITAHFT